MAMNQASVDKFSERVKPGGVIAYNQSLVDKPPGPDGRDAGGHSGQPHRHGTERPPVRQHGGHGRLGACSETGQRWPALVKGLMRVLPHYRHDAIALNETAIQRGIEVVKQVLAAQEGT